MKDQKIISLITALVISVALIYIASKYKLLNLLGMTRLKYFNLSEFDSRALASDAGSKYTKGKNQYLKNSGAQNMKDSTLHKLDKARDIIEKEWNEQEPASKKIVFSINSGYRTPQWNASKEVGGVPNSAHIFGHASDIAWSKYDRDQKLYILYALYSAGFRRFGIANGYVHVDDDTTKPSPSIWYYTGADKTLKIPYEGVNRT